jgi:glycosyltransferase involved in cell wall biosynthesis
VRVVNGSPPVQVDVVVPVYNEAHVLPHSITRLHRWLTAEFPFTWRITIVDNASTDTTLAVASDLAASLPQVTVIHLDRKGRGLALREAWMRSDATVCAYMDVDLSTGLDALAPLVAPLLSGHSDLAIGSRLTNARGETVFDKPAFRKPAMSRRCLVPISGLYEWQALAGQRTKRHCGIIGCVKSACDTRKWRTFLLRFLFTSFRAAACLCLARHHRLLFSHPKDCTTCDLRQTLRTMLTIANKHIKTGDKSMR